MQVAKKQLTETNVQLTITADTALLSQVKQEVLMHLNNTQIKVQGFRSGKAPLSLVEKQVEPSVLQNEFLDRIINELYIGAIAQEHIRPVERPQVTIKKFVPFSALEVEIVVEAVGAVKLSDYKKVKLEKKPVKITAKDVDDVVEALRVRAAEKKPVTRAAAKDDEVIINFAGTDTKTGESISGADGTEYPLILGSNSFIPGFEDNLIGVKPGEEKSFDLTFPKDYGVKALQDRKITFKTTVVTVNEQTKPKVDDAFAAQVGPFKTVTELKADIKKQLELERQQQSDRDYENELIEKITDQATVALPKALVDEEIERIESEERQNVLYRGQTWEEHLESEGVTAEVHQEQKRPVAEKRVKAGLVLSEIAEAENVDVSKEELEIRLQILKGQYQDKQMLAELDKPENRRDIASRIVTEKTVQKLVDYATAK